MNAAPHPALTLRELQPDDADFINRYWEEATDQDLERMGELQRPDAEENRAFIRQLCRERLPPSKVEEDILIWCFEERAIGYSSLKAIQFGAEAQTHLHMWEKELRGKGLGPVFFCLSALRFIKRFKLRTLHCQPKSDNPCPNGMLRKIGFPQIAVVGYERRDGSVIQQNRYLVRPEIAEAYLQRQAGAISSSPET